MADKELIMYGRSMGCPFITIAKRVFTRYSVEYREIFIDKDEEARRRVLEWTGFLSVPTLLIAQGIEVTTSLGYTFLIAIAAPFGPLLGLFFTERVERKWIIVAASLAIAGVGLVFAAQRAMAGILACGVALTLANNILSFAYHGYQPELFTTSIRAAAVGFVYSFSRLSTVGSSFIIAALLARFGAPGVFVFIAGCMGVVALVIGAFGPPTRGRALEEISR